MGVRRRDRWLPPDAFSLSEEARGPVVREFDPPMPVHAWLQTTDRLVRVEAVALAASEDAVLVEWGAGQAKTSAWIWRAAVKHRK
jgi:hypothetical protein